MRCRLCNFERRRDQAWGQKPFADLCACCAWWERLLGANRGLRYHGVHFTVQDVFDANSNPWFPQRITFELMDGTLIQSENVSCEGAIPTRYSMVLPDNVRNMTVAAMDSPREIEEVS